MRTVLPGIGNGLIDSLSTTMPPAEVLLTTLANQIAHAGIPFILVLDDYHTIRSELIDDAMRFFITHMPASMHLVIASRTKPPFALARLRAQGNLVELRAADLRFTRDEAADYFKRAALPLSSDAIATLADRTEGWIAGLQLAALSLRDQPDSQGIIESFTGGHAHVVDYLPEEVWQRQPADIQRFLLHTAILDRMCAALCDAITDDPLGSGQAMLERIDRANLFLVALDGERHWFAIITCSRMYCVSGRARRFPIYRHYIAVRVYGMRRTARRWKRFSMPPPRTTSPPPNV
ncbi:MAG: hypothetical protein SGJ24_08980 [Chloroflexota bacterium]|nr:hypothetical protein [Chloroflexota bacterium]